MITRDVKELRRAVRSLALQITGLIVLLFTGLGVTVYTIVSAGQAEAISQGLDPAESQEEMLRLLFALVVSGVVAVIAATIIGAFFAARALRPMARSLALQRRFVADASHELRTPLTLLSARAQLLRRRASSPHGPQSETFALEVEELVEDSRVLNEVLENLLIAADPREVVEREPVELGDLADATVAAFRAAAEDRGMSVSRGDDDEKVIVDGAPIAIRRVMTALVSNALDHATSRMTLEITREGSSAVIRVCDDGPGFDSGAELDAFARFATRRSEVVEGSGTRHYGLGLALVAEVAVRHGGDVNIEPPTPSRPGGNVTVRLPLGPALRPHKPLRSKPPS